MICKQADSPRTPPQLCWSSQPSQATRRKKKKKKNGRKKTPQQKKKKKKISARSLEHSSPLSYLLDSVIYLPTHVCSVRLGMCPTAGIRMDPPPPRAFWAFTCCVRTNLCMYIAVAGRWRHIYTRARHARGRPLRPHRDESSAVDMCIHPATPQHAVTGCHSPSACRTNNQRWEGKRRPACRYLGN